MMRRAGFLLGFAVALLSASSATAQEDDVLRRWFVFPDDDLTVEVLVDVPGALRITRGDPGAVRVAARAAGGLAEVGLAGRERERLELTAVGAERVHFVVVVPEDARVRIRLPDRAAAETLGTLDRAATYQWGEATDAEAPAGGAGRTDRADRPETPDAPTRPAIDPGHLAYEAARAPGTVDVRNLAGVRTLTVRWQGDAFRVFTGRPARVEGGRAEAIVLSPRGSPQDLVITVPRDAPQFSLVMGGAPALLLADGSALVLCSPVVDQTLDAARRWFTFTPDEGRLECRAPARRRHRSRVGR